MQLRFSAGGAVRSVGPVLRPASRCGRSPVPSVGPRGVSKTDQEDRRSSFARPDGVVRARMSLAEQEEISRGWPRAVVAAECDSRGRAPSTISREVSANGGPGATGPVRRRPVPDGGPDGPKTSKLAGQEVVPGGGGQTQKAVVAPADRRVAARGVPRRPGDAGEPRDHLPVAVRPGPRGAAKGALSLPAPGPGLSADRKGIANRKVRARSATWS